MTPHGAGNRGVDRTRPRDDAGTALVELTWLGILLLLPLVWVVVSVFHVQQGAFAVSGAARAAGRAYALAPTDAAGRARAQAAARQVLADHGIADAPLSVRVRCSPYPSDCHRGTSVVTVLVDSRVVLLLLPRVLGGGSPTFALHATHAVPIGQFEEVGRAAP